MGGIINDRDSLVLRSFYLSADLDERISSLAFKYRRERADMLRLLLEVGIMALSRDQVTPEYVDQKLQRIAREEEQRRSNDLRRASMFLDELESTSR